MNTNNDDLNKNEVSERPQNIKNASATNIKRRINKKEPLNDNFMGKNVHERINSLMAPKKENETLEEGEDNKSLVEEAKDKAKEAAKGAIKQKVKQTATAAIKKIALSNPVVLGIIVVVLLLFIILIAANGDDNYEYYRDVYAGVSDPVIADRIEALAKKIESCKNIKVYNRDGGYYYGPVDFESTYIPGVVSAEVGEFTDSPEVLKMAAIVARGYALKSAHVADEDRIVRDDDGNEISEKSLHAGDCYITGDATAQAFRFSPDVLRRITTEGHPIYEALKEVKNLVVFKEDDVLQTFYSSFCYEGEDDDNYLVGYGRNTIGSMQLQPIPKAWVENHRGAYYYVIKSKNAGRMCVDNHARGISQYGAYYLATQLGYTFEDILDYYITDHHIYSLVPTEDGYTYTPGVTNVSASIDEYMEDKNPTGNKLTIPLKDALAAKGSSVTYLNNLLRSAVVSAGPGTREAIPAVATTLITTLNNMNMAIPYAYGSAHYQTIYNSAGVSINKTGGTYYGVDPNWGSPLKYRLVYNKPSGTTNYYYYYGLDCSSFVCWTIYNAGFESITKTSGDLRELGTNYALDGSESSKRGKIGDLLYRSGHILIIVGADYENQIYYAAEANNGVEIRKYKFNQNNNGGSQYYIVDMENWYSNHRKYSDTTNYASGFISNSLNA